MRLKNYPINQLKKELIAIANKHLESKRGKYTLFFFGSRVTGKGNEQSDIDIGIESTHEIPASIMEKMKDALFSSSLPIQN